MNMGQNRAWYVTTRVVLLLFGCATALALTLDSVSLATGTGASGYRLAKRVPLGGEGLWDYLEVDPNTHHVLITRATRLLVVDPEQGKLVGEVPKTPFVHGIAVAPELARGFTTDGETSAVTIFDTNTLQKVGEAKSSKEPDAILYDPSSKHVFAMNRTGTSTVINPMSGKVAQTQIADSSLLQKRGAIEFANPVLG